MKVSPIVATILRENQKARNNDMDLIARVWYACGLKLTREQYLKLLEMPSAESITRERRKLQEQGLYRADPAVEQQRGQKAKRLAETAVKRDFDGFLDELFPKGNA